MTKTEAIHNAIVRQLNELSPWIDATHDLSKLTITVILSESGVPRAVRIAPELRHDIKEEQPRKARTEHAGKR